MATFFFLRDSTYVYENSVCLKPFDPLNLLCQSLRFLKLCSIQHFLTLKHPIFHVTGIIEIVFEPKPCLEKPKNKPKFRFYHCPPNCHQQATEQHPVKINYKIRFCLQLNLQIIRNSSPRITFVPKRLIWILDLTFTDCMVIPFCLGAIFSKSFSRKTSFES